jgi:hypothetical protein
MENTLLSRLSAKKNNTEEKRRKTQGNSIFIELNADIKISVH